MWVVPRAAAAAWLPLTPFFFVVCVRCFVPACEFGLWCISSPTARPRPRLSLAQRAPAPPPGPAPPPPPPPQHHPGARSCSAPFPPNCRCSPQIGPVSMKSPRFPARQGNIAAPRRAGRWDAPHSQRESGSVPLALQKNSRVHPIRPQCACASGLPSRPASARARTPAALVVLHVEIWYLCAALDSY
jgi:hypothetical protein